MTSFVFVYGSLKHGGFNHGLMQGQRFVGPARTQPLYRLYALDSYPAMVAAEQGGLSVEGELWEVEAARMPALDRLEDVAHGMYKRERIPLLAPHEKLQVEGYLYLRSVAGRRDCGVVWEV